MRNNAGPFAPMTSPPMPRMRTSAEVVRDYLAQDNPPRAILFVDDEEIMICDDEAEGRRMALQSETEFPDWKEIALVVYKPRYGGYLRALWRSRG